ncbi:MAG: helicase-related protein [Dehalococcoidia bacterium]
MRANLAALATLRRLQREQRPATAGEQAVLARWSGWGAVPDVFTHDRFTWARDQLDELLSADELAAARRSTLNAHYTDLELVRQVWAALARLGFAGGRVLEPGCGSGNFIAAAPDDAHIVGVEVEPVTAAIAAALHPHAQILGESFADTAAGDGSFDLVVGNVPFAKAALTDPVHNRGGHTIHNHFIIKSLHLVAPGGLVAVITSRYTLDAANPAARREMAQLADLVGAIRLPETAHLRAAGTRVVTDLLVLRRREPGREPADTGWERTQLIDLPTPDSAPGSAEHAGEQQADEQQAGEQVRVNSYFVEHPEMVCGRLSPGRGPFTGNDLTVLAEPDVDVAAAVSVAVDRLVAAADTAGLRSAPAPLPAAAAPRAALVGRRLDRAEGYLQVAEPDAADRARGGVGFTRLENGVAAAYAVPRSQAAELAALLGLRDCTLELLQAEAESLRGGEHLDRLRAELNDRYDTYLARFGPINRFTWRRTGRTDPDTGEERLARQRPHQGGFRTDPHAPVVYALELFDPHQQSATKADIFTTRVVAPRTPRLGADTPADALAICLDTHGRVDLDEIARLLGTSAEQARAALDTLVFDDPQQDGRLVAAAEYLSGNVRDRLAAARTASRTDPRYEPNIPALAEVVPADLQPEDIVARLGAAWIDADVVARFLRDTLDDASIIVEHPYGAVWTVKGADQSVAATSTWGTPDLPAPRLAQLLLQQQPVTVHDEVEYDLPGGGTSTRRVLNLSKTIAAQAKADELADRFSEWVWQDPARAAALARTYNDQFNSIVLRSYDDVQLSLPGLALDFTPFPHQIAAVARMIAEPAVGLYHEVGAGKTAEMAMGVMELRRLGLVNKTAVVVPNHMLEQFSREWLQLYPQAKLLNCSSDDLTRDRRRAFVARIATGDWDAVIITQRAFEKIPMSPKAQAAYLDDQVCMVRRAIEQQRGAEQRSFSLKRMERQLLVVEERIRERLAGDHDPAVTFEQVGIDYLVVDEAHLYKNLRTPSNIPDASIDGSNRASDLEMKLHYLRGRHGERVATLATATPIANSITEAHVMQRYLRPDLLAAAGVLEFDTWAATFGQTTTAVELSPDGGRFRIKSRFARFHNVPELLRMWHLSADIKTAEDLALPTPDLVPRPGDGARDPHTIVVARTRHLEEVMAELAARADAVAARQVDPSIDNMLKIAGDGRRAALDLRLAGRTPPPGESKIDRVAAQMLEIWAAHRGDRFPGADGEPHPAPGGLQIAFCDISTPDPDRWNVYNALRELLVAGGIPADQVRFVHEARNDREKAELFAAAREGRIAVLLGSTERMGVGTNVQRRARALHHIDCPWRPADLRQRDGRILRQGNLYDEVEIYRYVTERSFDAFMWQTVARKAQFIAQVMRGRLDVREIEDIGDSALSYNEVKALATGNPLLLDKAQADADLTRLERLERSHAQGRSRLRDLAASHERKITELQGQLDVLDTALTRRRDTRGDRFAMTVAGRRHTSRPAAGEHLRQQLLAALEQLTGGEQARRRDLPDLVELGGLRFDARVTRSYAEHGYHLQIPGLPHTDVDGSAGELDTSPPTSLIIRLENRVADLHKVRERTTTAIATSRAEIASAQHQADRPFPQAAALAAARHRVDELDTALAALAAPTEPEPTEPEPTEPEPTGRVETSEPTAPGARAEPNPAPPPPDPAAGPDPEPDPAADADAAGLDPDRRRLLVQLAEDYAALYGGPASPTPGASNAARYIVEGHLPDATSAEWDWLADHLAAHPELLRCPPLTDAQLARRTTLRTSVANRLGSRAHTLLVAEDFEDAQRLLQQARHIDPARADRWCSLSLRVQQTAHEVAAASAVVGSAPAGANTSGANSVGAEQGDILAAVANEEAAEAAHAFARGDSATALHAINAAALIDPAQAHRWEELRSRYQQGTGLQGHPARAAAAVTSPPTRGPAAEARPGKGVPPASAAPRLPRPALPPSRKVGPR